MILTTTKTVTEEQSVEIKTPCFFKSGISTFAMICENGAVIKINRDMVVRWQDADGGSYKTIITDVLTWNSISETEFFEVYKNTLAEIASTVGLLMNAA